MSATVYNCAGISVAINGIVIDKFGTNDMISLTPNSDYTGKVVTMKGDTKYYVSQDKTGVAVFSLMNNSSALKKFILATVADKVITMPYVITIIDGNKEDRSCVLLGCQIKKCPAYSFTKEIGETQIEFWYTAMIKNPF